jgi:hypothetical protein
MRCCLPRSPSTRSRGFGAHVLAIITRADSTVASLAEALIEGPTDGMRQFGGSLFEQSAPLLLDALVLGLTHSSRRRSRRRTRVISDPFGGLGPEQEGGGDQVALAAWAFGLAGVAARWKQLLDLRERVAMGHCGSFGEFLN